MSDIFPQEVLDRLRAAGVVAGFSVEKIEHAVPIAEALLAGGVTAIELTLRTPIALQAVKAVCQEVPDMLVGVGTILTPEAATEVKELGADFGVAPGLNPRVVKAAKQAGLPFAPGIATPSELESAVDLGCRFVKFFPAEQLGGVRYLRSMAAPYSHLGIEYFPLGGVNSTNILDYLSEPNIPAVGGSWIVQSESVINEDWVKIIAQATDVRNVLNRKHAPVSSSFDGNPSSVIETI